MVLTGKQALDYSGGVSAEDNFGIGGYERIMGPNGQAQYWAPDLAGACRMLLAHYEHTYVAPGERFPRRADTADPIDRDVRAAAARAPRTRRCAASATCFSDEANPGRKKPFDIRSVMRAVGRRRPPAARALGRDARRRDRGRLGRPPRRLAGVRARHRVAPAAARTARCRPTAPSSGPRARCSRARRRRSPARSTPPAAAGRSSCWPTSPASTARPSRCASWQLEYGAEIGRAVVNFRGPIVFCVVSRYHGGAFVVFSQRLNDELEAVARRGRARLGDRRRRPPRPSCSRARSTRRTRADPRIARSTADRGRRGRRAPALRAERAALWAEVRAEKLGELAAEFDAAHSVERAVRMGSVSRIVDAGRAAPVPDRRRRARHAPRTRRWTGAMAAGLADPLASLTSPPATAGSARASARVLAGLRVDKRRDGLAPRPLDGQGRARRVARRGPGALEVAGRRRRRARGVARRRARCRSRSRSATAPGARSPRCGRAGRRRLRPRAARAAQRRRSCATGWRRRSRRSSAGDPHRGCPNLVWTAKEAAAKVRREGLRLDVRSAVTRLEDGQPGRLAADRGRVDGRGPRDPRLVAGGEPVRDGGREGAGRAAAHTPASRSVGVAARSAGGLRTGVRATPDGGRLRRP